MNARHLLAVARPRPWKSVFDVMGGNRLSIGRANDDLIAAAVNEYEALLDVVDIARGFLVDGRFKTALARLDALRSDLPPVNAEPTANPAKATVGSDNEGA